MVVASGEGQGTGHALSGADGNGENSRGVIHVDIEKGLILEAVKTEDQLIAGEIDSDPAALPHHNRGRGVGAIEAAFIAKMGVSPGNEACPGRWLG